MMYPPHPIHKKYIYIYIQVITSAKGVIFSSAFLCLLVSRTGHLDGLLQYLEEGCGMDLRIIHQTLGVDPDQGADSGFPFFLFNIVDI